MPVLIHRTFTRYSLPSNWHRPFELPPYHSQSSMDLSSWMLKGSILTSGLNSEMILFPQNTSTISQTPSVPSILMVYFTTSDASMFQTMAISDYMFSSIHMTIPLQVISVRQRPFVKSACNTIGLDFQSTSRTTVNSAPLVPVPNLCATNPMDFIEKLPPSSGYTSILVIVDHLSKQSLFILTHDTITSPQLAQLFILHIFSKHSVPSHVTSDRSMEFVSHFFQSLRTALDMKLHFTLGYHPEGDGQTE